MLLDARRKGLYFRDGFRRGLIQEMLCEDSVRDRVPAALRFTLSCFRAG